MGHPEMWVMKMKGPLRLLSFVGWAKKTAHPTCDLLSTENVRIRILKI